MPEVETISTESQSSARYSRFLEIATPLTLLGWQVTGGGGHEDPYSAGAEAWLVASWNGKKKNMPSADSLLPHFTDDAGETPPEFGVFEKHGDTVLTYTGSIEGIRDFGDRALRYAGVQLLPLAQTGPAAVPTAP